MSWTTTHRVWMSRSRFLDEHRKWWYNYKKHIKSIQNDQIICQPNVVNEGSHDEEDSVDSSGVPEYSSERDVQEISLSKKSFNEIEHGRWKSHIPCEEVFIQWRWSDSLQKQRAEGDIVTNIDRVHEPAERRENARINAVMKLQSHAIFVRNWLLRFILCDVMNLTIEIESQNVAFASIHWKIRERKMSRDLQNHHNFVRKIKIRRPKRSFWFSRKWRTWNMKREKLAPRGERKVSLWGKELTIMFLSIPTIQRNTETNGSNPQGPSTCRL